MKASKKMNNGGVTLAGKVALACCLAGAMTGAQAAAQAASHVEVSGCWIRAMPASVPSSGYFTLKNDSDAPATLTGVATPAFGMAMLHRTESNGSTSTMVAIDAAEVPAHGELVFAPKGYHVMLEQPVKPPVPGSRIEMTFGFADGSHARATCDVKPAAYAGQPAQ